MFLKKNTGRIDYIFLTIAAFLLILNHLYYKKDKRNELIFKDDTSIVVTSFIAGNLHKIMKEIPYKVYRINNLFLKQD